MLRKAGRRSQDVLLVPQSGHLKLCINWTFSSKFKKASQELISLISLTVQRPAASSFSLTLRRNTDLCDSIPLRVLYLRPKLLLHMSRVLIELFGYDFGSPSGSYFHSHPRILLAK